MENRHVLHAREALLDMFLEQPALSFSHLPMRVQEELRGRATLQNVEFSVARDIRSKRYEIVPYICGFVRDRLCSVALHPICLMLLSRPQQRAVIDAAFAQEWFFSDLRLRECLANPESRASPLVLQRYLYRLERLYSRFIAALPPER